jgi:hypothetical protein
MITDEFQKNIREALIISEIDNREIQSIIEYLKYLNGNLPTNEIITNLFISNNPDPLKPDLYLFTDSLQIRVPDFPKFDPKFSERQDLKTTYVITPIKKTIISIDVEILKRNKGLPKTINVNYELKSGKTFSLCGKEENSLKLEFIVKEILLTNLELG